MSETQVGNPITLDKKIWFINRVTKKVGSTMAMVSRRPGEKGKDILEITYITTMKEAKEVDIYFNEEEWINDIKKL